MRCVRRAARPHGALCEPRFQPRMQHAAASVVTVRPCATGQGSGRLPGPAQSKQDALIKEINRLERGILPGETQPPARPSSGDLAAGAAANAQFHAPPARVPPGRLPAPACWLQPPQETS